MEQPDKCLPAGTMAAGERAVPEKTQADQVPGSFLLWLVLFVVMLVGGLSVLLDRGYRTLAAYPGTGHAGAPAPETLHTQLFRIVLHGQPSLILDKDTTIAFLGASHERVNQFDEHVDRHMAQWLELRIDEFLRTAAIPVDQYLDWYYSLSGSYMRLFWAVSGDIDTKIRGQIDTLVFNEGRLDRQMDAFLAALPGDYMDELFDYMKTQQVVSLASLVSEFQDRQSEAHLPAEGVDNPQVITIDLGAHLSDLFSPERARFERRNPYTGFGLMAGTAIPLAGSSVLLYRMAGAPASKAAIRVTRRYLARLPLQVSARALTSAKAAAATAPSGPGALVVAAGVFAAGIGVDWGLVKAEEARYRAQQKEEFLGIIDASLRAQSQQLAYRQRALFNSIRAEMVKSYTDHGLAVHPSAFRIMH